VVGKEISESRGCWLPECGGKKKGEKIPKTGMLRSGYLRCPFLERGGCQKSFRKRGIPEEGNRVFTKRRPRKGAGEN